MRIVLLNGKRKTENGKHHERKTKNGKRKAGRLSNGTRKVCESMVGTRHAVSDNKSVLGVPFPQRHNGKCPPPLYLLGFLKTYSLYFPLLLFITLPPLVLGHGMPCPYRHAFAFRSLPLPSGRTRSFEEALNVLLCLVRGELPSSTRGLAGVGLFPF